MKEAAAYTQILYDKIQDWRKPSNKAKILSRAAVKGLWAQGSKGYKNQCKIRSCKYCNLEMRLEIQNHQSEQR
jgi:ribosomal protein L32E